MGSLDPAKLLIILVIALVVIGPERLPKVARQIGGAWRELTKIRQQVTDEVRSVIPTDVIPHAGSPSAAVAGFIADIKSDIASSGTSSAASGEVTDVTPASDGSPAEDGQGAPTYVAPTYVTHRSHVADPGFVPDDASMN